MTGPIDCDVLTGFLGSGKTTLLKSWLQSEKAAGAAVIVNEIGEIGIDNLILAQVAENISLLESGCLCCTLSGTLRETIFNLHATARASGFPVTRIVIETTGLADPLPILHSLLGDKVLGEVVRLNQVIVTIDGQHGAAQLGTQPECVRQLAVAESAVITKTDLVDGEQLAYLSTFIEQTAPAAKIWASRAGEPAIDVFNETAGSSQKRIIGTNVPACVQHDHASEVTTHAHGKGTAHIGGRPHPPDAGETPHEIFHERVSTLAHYIDHAVSWAGIAAWWHLVSRRFGDDLLRCKGLLRVRDVAESYVFIQTVGRVFHPPETIGVWPDIDERPRLVCIGSKLDKQWISHSLAALQITEAGLLPQTLEELDALIPNTTKRL